MDNDDLRRKRRRRFSAGATDQTAIDLTEDMSEDEAYARRLQEDLEHGGAMPQPEASSSTGHTKRDESELADERMARELQAQFDSHSPDLATAMPSKAQPMSTSPVTSARDIENTLRTLHHSLRTHKCEQCAKSLFKHEKDVMGLFNSLMDQPTLVAFEVVCLGCQTSIRTENDRLALIWTLLCGFDNTSKHNKAGKKKRSTRSKTEASKGKGKGVGYGGSKYSDISLGSVQLWRLARRQLRLILVLAFRDIC